MEQTITQNGNTLSGIVHKKAGDLLLIAFFSLSTCVFQIVSDPRVRVEQALRDAGLQHSQYAKEVMSVIKPPKPPRPDMKSEIKF